MRRLLTGIAVCCLCMASISSSAQPSWLEWFPEERFFPTFVADPLAHQLSLSKILENREWIGDIGLLLPLLQAGNPPLLQIGVGATTFNRIIKTPGHISVSTIDYKVDFPLDVRLDSIRLRVGCGHISSHYADDGIEQMGKHSISSVKDYVVLGGAFMLRPLCGNVHAQTTYNYHSEPLPDKKWVLQFGAEGILLPLHPDVRFYGAFDVTLKEEVSWGSTQSYQIGARLFERAHHSLRIAYTHRRGFEERGQLYDQKVIRNVLSLFLDIL